MPTGRLADQEDSLCVDVVVCRVGMEPSYCTQHVLVAGGGGSAILETIIDRHGKEPKTRPLFRHDRALVRAMTADPTAAMHGNDGWHWSVSLGIRNVCQKCRPF